MPRKIGLIGQDGRTSALKAALERGSENEVVVLSPWKGAGVIGLPMEYLRARALEFRPDYVVVGPEAPLAEGVVDLLQGELGIPCIGPTQALAQLEASKAFTRNLLTEFGIPGNPRYRAFHSLAGLPEYLRALGGYVVKPDGLTGGKGVQVSGVHLHSETEALDYCAEVLAEHPCVVIEEKLEGEEFSLMAFCDGEHVVDMLPVQDHKRRLEGDLGPNTGGMGSYSCEDHGLPFLSPQMLAEASAINAAVGRALKAKTGQPYRGILYGGFMVTPHGLRLLEYNARFGDPETMNVLAVLETDLDEIFTAMLHGMLDRVPVRYAPQATVCKYVVPQGYPEKPERGVPIDLSAVPPDSAYLRRYAAAIEERDGEVFLTGSRAIAFVGVGDTLAEAEQRAEEAASAVRGPVAHRRDIGTADLVAQRVQHVRELQGSASSIKSEG